VGAADPLGADEAPSAGESVGAGDELTVGEPEGAGDELTVGEADGDVTTVGVAVGVAVGIALADAVAGADVDGATVMADEVLGADDAGAEVAGEVSGLDTACPAWAPDVWCVEAARAMPPAADAASSPTTIEAIVSGRASRRRCRRLPCRPGPPGAGRETGDSLADVTVPVGSFIPGSSRNVQVTASGTQPSVGGTAPGAAANSRSRAVGRWPGSLARQRWISPRAAAGTRSRFTWR